MDECRGADRPQWVPLRGDLVILRDEAIADYDKIGKHEWDWDDAINAIKPGMDGVTLRSWRDDSGDWWSLVSGVIGGDQRVVTYPSDDLKAWLPKDPNLPLAGVRRLDSGLWVQCDSAELARVAGGGPYLSLAGSQTLWAERRPGEPLGLTFAPPVYQVRPGGASPPVRIRAVDPDGPAGRAGVQPDSRIFAIQGAYVISFAEAQRALAVADGDAT
eukprot:gene45443-4967_t